MSQRHQTIRFAGRLSFAVLVLNLVAVVSAHAHHPMGGKTPSTFVEGLLSGFGHPIIGIDHLAFIVAVGAVVGVAGLNLGIPAVFVVASALGVAAHVSGVSVPGVEFVVATSVVLAGALLAWGRTERINMWGWAALFGVAGLFHGYAYGESIFGAEATPLAAYLLGLVIVQTALVTAVAWLIRQKGAAMLTARLTGAVVAGVGLVTLAGQIVPA
jgi:urease accessory protein